MQRKGTDIKIIDVGIISDFLNVFIFSSFQTLHNEQILHLGLKKKKKLLLNPFLY